MRKGAGVLGAVLLLGGLVGCGGGGQTVVSVMSAAPAKTQAAKTAQLSLSLTLEGQTVDVNGVFDLSGRRGTFTTKLPGLGSVDAIQDQTTLYEKLPAQTSALVGKPWIKFDVVTGLQKLTGVNSQFFTQSLSSDPTSALDYLRGATTDTRKVGGETLRGASTTHYRGTIDLNVAAAHATDPSRKSGFQQIAKVIGVSAFPVDVWIDGAGRMRQMRYSLDASKFNVPAAGGLTITGTATYNFELYDFGVPFTMPALPAPDQVADINSALSQPSPSVAPTPSSSGAPLASAMIPAPDGFAPSTSPDVHNGPLDAAGFDQLTGSKGSATQLHFVAGYDVTYDSSTNNDTVEVSLLDFSSPTTAASFEQVFVGGMTSNGLTATPDREIPGAVAADATKADSSGSYEHAAIARKDTRVLVVDYTTDTAGPVSLVATLAKQQYDRL